MNWLDRAINWVSPAAGERRLRSRTRSQVLLAYDGVRSDRRAGGWVTRGSSGNAEIGPAASKLRDNARDLARNNAYGRRIGREWSKRIVGTGITGRAATGSDALDKVINAKWAAFCKQCMTDRRMQFAAAQRVMVKTECVSGEVFIRLWTRRLEDGLAVPFQIQILEPDYLDSSKTMPTATGYIVQGVDYDQIGRIRGYWLYGQHPGDVVFTSNRGLTSKFVPARDVLHYGEVDRPGDARSVSRLASVIAKLRDVDEYADAEIVRKKIEACMVGAVTTAEGADGATLAPTVQDSTGKKIEKFEPGMMMYGSSGADVKFFSPTGSGDFAAHKKTELREVAVGVDIPYILLDDNLEAVNYSSGRLGLLTYKEAVQEHRWNWFIPQALDPIWERFIDTLAFQGVVPDGAYGHVWDVPAFELLDRAAEAEADRAELQIGKKTWPQLIGEQGDDPETHAAEIEKWGPRLVAAGVTYAKSTSEATSATKDQSTNPNA